jgi:hypothetical protein
VADFGVRDINIEVMLAYLRKTRVTRNCAFLSGLVSVLFLDNIALCLK